MLPKAMQMLCRHLPRLHDYLWLAEDGMKMQGYNGSQLWDTAFAVQAFAATGMSKQFSTTLQSAHSYIHNTQVRFANAMVGQQLARSSDAIQPFQLYSQWCPDIC